MSSASNRRKGLASDWHKADVIAALHKRGTSLRQLALARDLNPRTLTLALHRPYYAAEQIIARAIGVPAERIWPSRYNPRTPFGVRRFAQLNASRGASQRNVERPDTGVGS